MTSVPRFVLVLLWGLLVALHAAAEPSAPPVAPSDAAPSPAMANTDDAARAKALFQEARNLVAAGDYNAACPRFEQSAKLVEGLGTLFNLADCWTHLRRTQSAAALYRKVERLALANGQDQRADVARQRAVALEASLSRLLIRLEDPHTVTTVRRNGETLGTDAIGTPMPVDPGKYLIVASAPGRRSWSLNVDVPDSAVIVTVAVPVLDDSARVGAAAPATSSSAPEAGGVATEPATAATAEEALSEPETPAAEKAPAAPASPPSPWVKRSALILGGVGAGAVIAGAIFAAQYQSSNQDAKRVCPSSYDCSSREISQHTSFVDDARRARMFSYVGFGVGAAALISAGVVYLTAPHDKTEQTVTAAIGFTPNSAGAVVSGRF